MPHRHPPRRARLGLTALERRLAPATFTVFNTNNAGGGSLRQAVLDANALAGADLINFDPTFFGTPRTITLTAAAGQLLITDDVTITGPGAALLTVSGGGVVRVFNVANTAAVVNAAISGLTVTGGNGTANGTSPSDGGGILLGGFENLTLDSVVVTGNTAQTADGGGIALGFSGGILTVRNCTVSGNTGRIGGGIYFAASGGLLMENSTVSGNVATGSFGGGIYFTGTVRPSGFTIRNSTIAGNTTAGSGGGLALPRLNALNGPAVIQNCTITGNTANTTDTAAGSGGGGIAIPVASRDTALSLVSTIVSGNTATAANGRSDLTAPAVATVNVNFCAIGDPDGFTPSAASGNNLTPGANLALGPLADNGGATQTVALGAGSDAVNAGSDPANLATDQRGPGHPRVAAGAPDIGAYESDFDRPSAAAQAFSPILTSGGTGFTFTVTYGGATPIDVATLDDGDILVTGPGGFSAAATFVSVTPPSNGTPRTATYALAAPGGTFGREDNGLYAVALVPDEVANTGGATAPAATLGPFRVAIPTTYTVTNLNDAGAGSLRQAILDANATPGVADTIVFQPGLTGTITLTHTSGQLLITDGVTIIGPGAGNLTIHGNRGSGFGVRVFKIANADATIDVTISGMTITGGNGQAGGGVSEQGYGAGISTTNENVTLDGVVLTGNVTIGYGGGGFYATDGATVTIRNSTVSDNQSAIGGGGIGFFVGGTLLIENSTISGNATDTDVFGGGGLYWRGLVRPGGFTIRNSTIAGNRNTNTADGSGGGIFFLNLGGTALIQNSTITANTVATTATGDGDGGGGIAFSSGTNSILTLVGTVVAGNTAANGRDDIAANAAATVNANFSAIGDPDGFTPSASSGNNLPFGTALGLGVLANNGGPTATISFAADSPLRNAGANPANLATDQRGPGFLRVEGPAADIGAFEFQVVAAPRVASVAVNTGQANAAKRSRVTSITVTFDQAVTFVNPADVAAAFGLSRIGGGAVGGFTATASVVGGVTVVVLSGFTGTETEFGSLADGRYQLTVRASQVVGLGGDGNGQGGDDYTLAGSVANGLYRLYGDANGDGTVNAFDYGQFRPAFGSSTGQAAYLDFLDFDGDGVINAFDFSQLRSRFGGSVP